METVRVLRVIEYVGTREWVENTVNKSIHGEKDLGGGNIIRGSTVGNYPEVIRESTEKDAVLDMSLFRFLNDDSNVATRLENTLKRNGIRTVRDLTNIAERELKHYRNIGKKCVDMIKDKLAEKGLNLKPRGDM